MTPNGILSPHCICAMMKAVYAIHLCGYAVKVVLSGWPRHYRLVVTGLSFLRLSFGLKLDISYSKTETTGPTLIQNPKYSTVH